MTISAAARRHFFTGVAVKSGRERRHDAVVGGAESGGFPRAGRRIRPGSDGGRQPPSGDWAVNKDAWGGAACLPGLVARRDELTEQLRRLGVRPGDVLVTHTSFRAVGPVEGGPAGLVEALRAALGETGTLVMPSMTDGETPYDPAHTPTDGMGVVAETFWRLPGVLRGDHPGSAFAAVGRHARVITAPQPISPPHGVDSPVGRAWRLGGAVLLLGVGHDSNTTMHLAEDLARAPYHSRSLALVMDGGAVRQVEVEEPNHCCQGFALADDWLRERGAQREGLVGRAHARLVRAQDLIDVVVPRLRAEPLVFLCPPAAACVECDQARASAAPR